MLIKVKALSLCMLACFLVQIGSGAMVSAEEKNLELAKEAVSAILIDKDTGTIMYEKNSHQRLAPASMTKIMTMLLIMEALDKGKIKLSDMVSTSEYAASMGGSQIFLEPGEKMSVSDLLKGIAVASGNDAAVAMAEYIAGSEEAFVQMMNQKAQELGLKDTHFTNSNGLPMDNLYSSAYDMAIMSKELLKHEQITKYTGIYQDYLRKNTKDPFWLVNTNRLVRFYDGVDGIKTGYTSEAKYCLSATAKKGTFRVIAVVMGAPSSKVRNAEVTQMFNYAFSQYTNHRLYKKGEVIQAVTVDKGDSPQVNVVADDDFGLLLKKGEKLGDYQMDVQLNPAKAPLKQGDKLGQLLVIKDGQTIAQLDLVAENDVKKAGWWQLTKRSLLKIFLVE
jgi:D-alanyl-D-alanine carboxypeptidase (penicillin-binding protein 5/6)